MKILNWLTLLIIVTGLMQGCFAPDTITLSDTERNAQIDSLVQERIELLTPIMEENCTQNFERYVAKAVDSLVNAHLDSTKYQ